MEAWSSSIPGDRIRTGRYNLGHYLVEKEEQESLSWRCEQSSGHSVRTAGLVTKLILSAALLAALRRKTNRWH